MLLSFPNERTALVKLYDEAPLYILQMCSGDNRFNRTFVQALHSALDHISSRPILGRALITIGTDRFFSNGLDLAAISTDPHLSPPDFMSICYFPLLQKMLNLGMPTVAAINGHAYAGGMVLAMAHDYRIMRTDRGYLCMNEILLPSPIPNGMLSLLKAKISNRPLLRDIVLTAKRLSAQQALDAGLVDDTCDNDSLLPKAKEIALTLTKINTETFHTIKTELNKEAIAALHEKAPNDLFDIYLRKMSKIKNSKI